MSGKVRFAGTTRENGKPVSPEAVTATYDGLTDIPNAYASFTEPYGEGRAKIKISASGLWMVRVQYIVDEKSAKYEQHAMRELHFGYAGGEPMSYVETKVSGQRVHPIWNFRTAEPMHVVSSLLSRISQARGGWKPGII